MCWQGRGLQSFMCDCVTDIGEVSLTVRNGVIGWRICVYVTNAECILWSTQPPPPTHASETGLRRLRELERVISRPDLELPRLAGAARGPETKSRRNPAPPFFFFCDARTDHRKSCKHMPLSACGGSDDGSGVDDYVTSALSSAEPPNGLKRKLGHIKLHLTTASGLSGRS